MFIVCGTHAHNSRGEGNALIQFFRYRLMLVLIRKTRLRYRSAHPYSTQTGPAVPPFLNQLTQYNGIILFKSYATVAWRRAGFLLFSWLDASVQNHNDHIQSDLPLSLTIFKMTALHFSREGTGFTGKSSSNALKRQFKKSFIWDFTCESNFLRKNIHAWASSPFITTVLHQWKMSWYWEAYLTKANNNQSSFCLICLAHVLACTCVPPTCCTSHSRIIQVKLRTLHFRSQNSISTLASSSIRVSLRPLQLAK